jgi:hypothetical protein
MDAYGMDIPGNQNNPSTNINSNQEEPKILKAQTPPSEYFKKLFNLSGGSIFYCLSAFAIIYGVTQTIGPLLAEGKNLKEALMCVFTLNIYELALLAVLVLIVVFRNVTDDAISLIVIAALFLVGSGATLGAAGYRQPKECLLIGIVCCILGIGKLFVLRNYIKIKIGILAFAGLTLILLWNFLAGTLISDFLLSGAVTRNMMKQEWINGWCVFLFGILLIFADGIKITEKEINEENDVFLHRYSMVRLFALLLIAAGCAHSYAMAYMFAVNHYLGDYLPFTVIFSLMFYEFLRSLKDRDPLLELFTCCIPVCAMVISLGTMQIKTPFQLNQNILWYPPVLMAITGGVVFGLGIWHKNKYLKYAAMIYVFFMLLTIRFDPYNADKMNWKLAGSFFMLTILAIGIIRKNMSLCVLTIFIVVFSMPAFDKNGDMAERMGLTVPGLMALFCGVGLFCVCIGFGRQTPKLVSVFASFILMLAAFDYFQNNSDLMIFIFACGLIFLGLMVFWRTKHIVQMVFLFVPILYKIYDVGRGLSNWRAMIAGFVFLFVGADKIS